MDSYELWIIYEFIQWVCKCNQCTWSILMAQLLYFWLNFINWLISLQMDQRIGPLIMPPIVWISVADPIPLLPDPYSKGCIQKILIFGRSQFTTRKKILTYNFFSWFSTGTYSLGFWVVKSALNVVSVSIFDDLRYFSENVRCQPYMIDASINMHIFFVLVSFSWIYFVLSIQKDKCVDILAFLQQNRYHQWKVFFHT